MILSQQSRLCSFAVSRNRLKCFTLVSKVNITIFKLKTKQFISFQSSHLLKNLSMYMWAVNNHFK